MGIVAEAHAVFLTQEAESKPCRTWDEISESYDGELGRDETVMGMKLCRWWLVRQAKVEHCRTLVPRKAVLLVS